MKKQDTADIPWNQSGWLEQATRWTEDELVRQGITLTGVIEQPHVRPWSTILRVPTTAGDVYFKAVSPLVAHEVPLILALTRWQPDLVLPVLAADPTRHWLLLPDGGVQFRKVIRADHDLGHWEKILPLYAEFQMDLASRVPEMLALGTPDRRLATLLAHYERLLAQDVTLRVGQADGLTSEEYERLRALAPRVADLCQRLADYAIPESLNHGDFHDGNIFLRDGRPVFFDWGDSVVSHPFFSLRTALVSAEISLGLEENAPELNRLREAYLEPWTRYTPREALRTALALALPLAAINGALTWHEVVSTLDAAGRAEYAAPVPALLQEFLAAEAAPS